MDSALLRILVMGISLVLAVQTAHAQDSANEVFSKINKAIAEGDAKSLQDFFANTVEISVPGDVKIFSSQQAYFIIKEFFSKNEVQTYSELHRGESAVIYYSVGECVTSKGIYDSRIFVKEIESVLRITDLLFVRD